MNRFDYIERLDEIAQLVDEAYINLGTTLGRDDFQRIDQIASEARSLADTLEFDLSFE